MKKYFSIFVLQFFFVSLNSFAGEWGFVEKKFNELNNTRETLAASLDKKKDPITELDFKNVCMPVGMEFKKWIQSQGYTGKQVSEKNRNPAHAPSEYESKILNQFLHDKNLKFFYEKGTFQNQAGTFLFGRIDVVSSCLHCHGEMKSRPDFVQKKYLQDKAFDYKAGDLRGMYSVFIPDIKKK